MWHSVVWNVQTFKKDTIKILGIHYSYNQALENDQNFTDHIIKIENVLKLWRSRSLNLEGKITVFKCLALSKIIHLALVKPIPNTTIEELKYKRTLFGAIRNQK